MFVQALAAFTDNTPELRQQLEDESWEEKPVPYLIEVDHQGRFLAAIPRLVTVVRGKKSFEVGAPLPVPRSPVNRNSGLHPLLTADDIKYVLGPGGWTGPDQVQNSQERHRAFIELICKAASATGDTGLGACARFYAQPEEVQKARDALKSAKPGTIVALSSGGPLVSTPATRAFWRTHYQAAARLRVAQGGEGECLISGVRGPIAPTHEKVKGLAALGGQPAGVALMSFDKEAFRSYGWDQNANSPVSPDRAMAYILALNHLLQPGGPHRRDVSGVAFVFWTRTPSTFDPWSCIEQPSPEDVQFLLNMNPLADPDPNEFYLAGIGANGARLQIRCWVTGTLEQIKANLRGWFQGLQMADVYQGGLAALPRMYQLCAAMDREGTPPANRVLALVRRALGGPSQKLGLPILATVLGRLRADESKRADAAALGLVRLSVNDSIATGVTPMSESLDQDQKNGAYLCGRLLAVFEAAQYYAHRPEPQGGKDSDGPEVKINVTVVDRYFSLASTFPALAFPKLEDLNQKHMRKLRKARPGLAFMFTNTIDGLMSDIALDSGFRFPSQLDLVDQGRFVLGYHHQRASQLEAAREASTKRKSSQANENEIENVEEE
jgi:CRISPR-associated protein Csd1